MVQRNVICKNFKRYMEPRALGQTDLFVLRKTGFFFMYVITRNIMLYAYTTTIAFTSHHPPALPGKLHLRAN